MSDQGQPATWVVCPRDLGLGLVFLGATRSRHACVYLSLAYLAYRVYTGSRHGENCSAERHCS